MSKLDDDLSFVEGAMACILGLPTEEDIRRDIVAIGLFTSLNFEDESIRIADKIELLKKFHEFGTYLSGFVSKYPNALLLKKKETSEASGGDGHE